METQSPVSGYFSLYIYISTANLGTPLRFRHHFGVYRMLTPIKAAYNNHPVSPLTTVIGNTVVIWNTMNLACSVSSVHTIRYSPILKLYICPLSRQKCTAEKKDGETINTLLPDDDANEDTLVL